MYKPTTPSVVNKHPLKNQILIIKLAYPLTETLPVIFSGLLAAIFWNLLTWWYGIPSSSSHTLIGGFAGAAIASALMIKGIDYSWAKIVDSETIIKTVLFIFLAPIIGIVISIFITVVTIMRNIWWRLAIICIATLGTVLMFDKFEDTKIKENVQKFYSIDKYQKEVASINEELETKQGNSDLLGKLALNQEKLDKAKKMGMPLQDDPKYKKLRLFKEQEIGKKSLEFFCQ